MPTLNSVTVVYGRNRKRRTYADWKTAIQFVQVARQETDLRKLVQLFNLTLDEAAEIICESLGVVTQ